MNSNEPRIIGGFLMFNDNIDKIYGTLKAEMFEDELCRMAYEKILQSYGLGLDINPVDLSMIMEGQYDQETILKFLTECVKVAATVSEIKACAKSIVNSYKARTIQETIKESSFLQKDIDKTLIALKEKIEELEDTKRQKGRALTDISKEFADYYGQEHEEGIKTHIYPLDETLNGLGKGDVTILGARPAVGKSALATQILSEVAMRGHRVGYFNLEMTDQQIYERILARYSEINLTRLRKAISFMPEEKEKYEQGIEKIKKLKDLVIFSGSYSALEMKNLCRNQKFDLIVIDYLQLVKADKNYGNRVAEVGDISKSIKAMAMELKVPVIALSQLNRSKGATDEPSISDLRESGDIEQDASNVLLMWNMNEEGTYKGLKVEKNRQGELNKMALKYTGSLMKFETLPYKTFEQVEMECRNGRNNSNKNRENPFN